MYIVFGHECNIYHVLKGYVMLKLSRVCQENISKYFSITFYLFYIIILLIFFFFCVSVGLLIEIYLSLYISLSIYVYLCLSICLSIFFLSISISICGVYRFHCMS